MIYALLFLILFALLFPKAMRFLFALLFIGGIMVLGEVHAAETVNWVSLWNSVNGVCHSDSQDADRACNQIAVLETMMKDNGCKFRHKQWICPTQDYDKMPPDCSGPILTLPPECDASIKNN